MKNPKKIMTVILPSIYIAIAAAYYVYLYISVLPAIALLAYVLFCYRNRIALLITFGLNAASFFYLVILYGSLYSGYQGKQYARYLKNADITYAVSGMIFSALVAALFVAAIILWRRKTACSVLAIIASAAGMTAFPVIKHFDLMRTDADGILSIRLTEPLDLFSVIGMIAAICFFAAVILAAADDAPPIPQEE